MNTRLSMLLGALSLAACSGQETKPAQEAPPAAPIAAPIAAPGPKPEPIPAPMSQADAAAKAKAAISKENADAELEKIKKELAGG